jgi:Flp pilus assembly protein TadG
MVIVAIALVPILGLGALAIDVSWWQVGATQLQTAADAAALAAARGLQLYPSNAQSMATSYATTIAGENIAFNAPVAVADGAVEPLRWNPANGGSFAAAGWTATGTSAPNAVRVTVAAQPTGILAGATGVGQPTVRRSAIAWIANIKQRVREAVRAPVPGALQQVRRARRPPDEQRRQPPQLDQRQLTAISNASVASRIVILRGPTVDTTQALGASLTSPPSAPAYRGNDGAFAAYSFTGNAGGTGYVNSIPSCSNVSVTVDNGTTLPGNNDLECRTVLGLMDSNGSNCNGGYPNNLTTGNRASCFLRPRSGSTWDAGCYADQAFTTLGGDDAGGVGRQHRQRLERGRLPRGRQLPAVVRVPQRPGDRHRVVQHGQSPAPAGYPKGTLVGVIQGLSNPTIAPGVELGNQASDQQRLILVR